MNFDSCRKMANTHFRYASCYFGVSFHAQRRRQAQDPYEARINRDGENFCSLGFYKSATLAARAYNVEARHCLYHKPLNFINSHEQQAQRIVTERMQFWEDLKQPMIDPDSRKNNRIRSQDSVAVQSAIHETSSSNSDLSPAVEKQLVRRSSRATKKSIKIKRATQSYPLTEFDDDDFAGLDSFNRSNGMHFGATLKEFKAKKRGSRTGSHDVLYLGTSYLHCRFRVCSASDAVVGE